MKKLLLAVALSAFALVANAQLIYGNTFPFWNVNGPFAVVGTSSLTGTTTQTGALNITGITTHSGAVVGATSQDVFNTVSTTLNIGGAATTVAIGAATGTTTIANAIVNSIATDSTTSTTGAIKTAGGIGVAKNLVVGAQLIVAATASPAAADACTAGRIVWDASYLYVCTATGVWKRAAITGGY